MATAANCLSSTGVALAAQNAAAAVPTTAVVPPAADEVSAMLAARFAVQAQQYHQISAQAAAIHETFVATLNGGANAYATAEAANAIAAG